LTDSFGIEQPLPTLLSGLFVAKTNCGSIEEPLLMHQRLRVFIPLRVFRVGCRLAAARTGVSHCAGFAPNISQKAFGTRRAFTHPLPLVRSQFLEATGRVSPNAGYRPAVTACPRPSSDRHPAAPRRTIFSNSPAHPGVAFVRGQEMT